MLRNRVLIIGLVAALLALNAYFGMDYMKRRSGQGVLASELADTAAAMARYGGDTSEDLEKQLAFAHDTLETVRGQFPQGTNSTYAIDSILRLAVGSGLKALPVATHPWITEEVGEHVYQVMNVEVSVEGSLSQLASFISVLENGAVAGLVIEDVTISESKDPEQAGLYLATLELAIYSGPMLE